MSEESSPIVTGEALAVWLRRAVLATGRAQVLLARDSGLTTKHVNQMLKGRISGSLDAWDRLLDAALRPPPARTYPPVPDGAGGSNE